MLQPCIDKDFVDEQVLEWNDKFNQNNATQTKTNCKLYVDGKIIVQPKKHLMLMKFMDHALSPVYARCTFDGNLCFCHTLLLLLFSNKTDTTNYLTSELSGVLFACVQDL